MGEDEGETNKCRQGDTLSGSLSSPCLHPSVSPLILAHHVHVIQQSHRTRPCTGGGKVSKLPSGTLSGACAPAWIDFRTPLWGKETFQKMELVKRDGINPVDGIASPDYHLVATVPPKIVPSWGLEHEKIFVPSEYNRTEQAALLSSRPERRVFLVNGWPGTGLLPSLSAAACRI